MTARELRFLGFELSSGSTLAAQFDAIDEEGAAFLVTAEVASSGAVVDVQATDCETPGTTGRPEVDALIRRRVAAELVRARSAAVVAAFDRRLRKAGGR